MSPIYGKRRRVLLILAGLLIAVGCWQLGQSAYLHGKAWLAQRLLSQAWAETLTGQQQVRPWPWADAWPVARLSVPDLAVDQIVLSNASGRSLAFAPGHVIGTARPGAAGHILIGGHRDTHFAFLADLAPGMEVRLQDAQGQWRSYRIDHRMVLDHRSARLATSGAPSRLTLVTCYPFDALRPGGPLRFLATAAAAE